MGETIKRDGKTYEVRNDIYGRETVYEKTIWGDTKVAGLSRDIGGNITVTDTQGNTDRIIDGTFTSADTRLSERGYLEGVVSGKLGKSAGNRSSGLSGGYGGGYSGGYSSSVSFGVKFVAFIVAVFSAPIGFFIGIGGIGSFMMNNEHLFTQYDNPLSFIAFFVFGISANLIPLAFPFIVYSIVKKSLSK